MKIIKLALMFLGGFYIFISFSSAAEVEVFSIETDNYAKLDLKSEESAELTIYLKSFGDLVYGYKVLFFNDNGELIGENFSNVDGIVVFTKIPAGKYRVVVEKKVNERGGPTMVSVGEMQLKIDRTPIKVLKEDK